MQRCSALILLASISSALAASPAEDRRAILVMTGNFKVGLVILSQNNPSAIHFRRQAANRPDERPLPPPLRLLDALHAATQLRDMRRWSHQTVRASDAN